MNTEPDGTSDSENWKREYFEILNRPNVANIDWQKAYAFKGTHLPQHLYRYRSFDKEEYSIASLRTGRTWVANPQTFSDPFDSSLSLALSRLAEYWIIKNLPRLMKEGGYAELLPAEVEDIVKSENPFERIAEVTWEKAGVPIPPGRREAYARKFETMMGNVVAKFEKDSRDALRVCCFCENSTSIPMWTHYGGDHTGFCLQYEVKDLVARNQLGYMLHPVHYSNTRFDASEHISPEYAPNPWIPVIAACNKSTDWSYEAEWRVVLLTGDFPADQLYEFAPPSRIIMGARSSHERMEELRAIPRLTTTPFSRARLSRTKFAIEF